MIQLLHLSKTYPPNHQALTEITLEISAGEIVFIVGPSGAGKSTLLKLLFRAEEPSAGEIYIAGTNIGHLNRRGVARLRRTIGLVFQECKLLASLTALQNVSLAAEAVGVPARLSRLRAHQLLRELGLKGRSEAVPLALSAGERQRVALARALINEPKLVLADEPTGNLDSDTADQIMRLLMRMRGRGATVIIATHDHGVVERYGTRVISLERGMLADERGRLAAGGGYR